MTSNNGVKETKTVKVTMEDGTVIELPSDHRAVASLRKAHEEKLEAEEFEALEAIRKRLQKAIKAELNDADLLVLVEKALVVKFNYRGWNEFNLQKASLVTVKTRERKASTEVKAG